MAQHSLVCQGFLIIEASQSHSDTPHSVGTLRTRGQPEAETSLRRQTSMPSAGFETANTASERPQTHALDFAATRIGTSMSVNANVISIFAFYAWLIQMVLLFQICLITSHRHYVVSQAQNNTSTSASHINPLFDSSTDLLFEVAIYVYVVF